MSEHKSMNISPQFVFGLEQILDELAENAGYQAKIGNIVITPVRTKEGEKQKFIIERWQDE